MSERTIHALEPAAGRHKDVVAVGTEQLHRVVLREIDAPAGNNVAASAVDTWAHTKDAAFILFCLEYTKREVS